MLTEKAFVNPAVSADARAALRTVRRTLADYPSIEMTRLISSLLKPIAAVLLRFGRMATS